MKYQLLDRDGQLVHEIIPRVLRPGDDIPPDAISRNKIVYVLDDRPTGTTDVIVYRQRGA